MFRWVWVIIALAVASVVSAETPATLQDFSITWRPTLEDVTAKVEKFCDAAEKDEDIEVVDVKYFERHGHHHAVITCRVAEGCRDLAAIYPDSHRRNFWDPPDFSDVG